MKIISVNNEHKLGPIIANWYSEKANTIITPPYSLIAAIDDNYDVKGVVWFYNYYEFGNVDVHMYAPGCFNRSSLKYTYNYIFNELNCTRLTAKVPKKNKKLLKIMTKLGFQYEFTQKRYYSDSDAIVYVLFKENVVKCPLLKPQSQLIRQL